MGFFRRILGLLNPFAGSPLSGEWVEVVSSWVAAARWDDGRKTLWVKTKQGYAYPWAQGITRAQAVSFFRADSKGKWIWRHFPPRGLPRRGRGRRLRGGR